MHITKSKLRKIIKEEIQGLISEISPLIPGGSFPGRGPAGRRPGLTGVASGQPGLGAPSHDPGQVAEDPEEVEEVAAMLKGIKPSVLRSALDVVLGPHAPLREEEEEEEDPKKKEKSPDEGGPSGTSTGYPLERGRDI